MERTSKIKNILNSLGYLEDSTIKFVIKRFEKVDHIHVSVTGKDEEKLMEMFELFHKKHEVKISEGNFPSSVGELDMSSFMDFLEEYDKKFNLDWCEIDFKELTVKPVYL